MTYVPEISYGTTDPDEINAGIVSRTEEALGRSLAPADPLRLFALAYAAENILLRNLIDEAGRQNLLPYATGEYLDALGALIGVLRLEPVAATTTLRFTAAEAASEAITIPAGTRATPDGQTYFATDAETEIAIGQTTVDAPATCTVEGEAGNGFLVGEIDEITDLIGGVPTVSNLTASAGGSDTEEDEPYRARIRLGVTAFSVAGPRDAYEYWARTASAQITDVLVTSPDPGEVDVYVLLEGGAIPNQDMLDVVEAILTADNVRPLTDLVTAKAPTPELYTVELTYYIRTEDVATASEIQTAVEAAIDDWVLWQRSVIGRDVNPSELTARIVNAGAKRVEITTPAYDVIADGYIAVLDGEADVTYGGTEDE